jgi:non-ribosomal peptide synthetase component E (peptide arylation enzyme)
VREAAVFVAEEGIEGSRVGAAIVRSGPITWQELGEYAARKLEVRAPVRYYEVESLPRNALGKLDRTDLAQWVATNGKLVSGTSFR